jgi:glycosyltransferase involved in cell wall biosynthesis
MKKKILVKAPALSRSGYGEQTRFALRALRSVEDKLDIYIINIPWGASGFVNYYDEERQWIEHLLQKTAHYAQSGGQFDISLQITIPNEFTRLAPINVGFTAGIETTKVAPQWIELGNMMDKILVVSDHSKNVYENTAYDATNNETGEVIPNYKITTPIESVNYCVRGVAPPQDLDIELDYDFNFLVMAQAGPRKNLPNTIKWFVEEFIDQEVGLVVKASIASDSLADRIATEERMKSLLAAYPDRKCKVYLLHGTLEESQLSALYQNKKIKAMLSLTHGEGFGLPLFEAVCNGVPVICPLWSGQSDFLYAPVKDKKSKKTKMVPHCAKIEFDLQPVQAEAVWDGVVQADSLWCYPRQGSCKMRLREVYKNYGRFEAQAKKLQTYVLKEFGAEKQYKQFSSAILDLVQPTKEEQEWQQVIGQVVNYD